MVIEFLMLLLFSIYFFLDNECGWCRNSIAPSQSDFMVTPDGSRYCSEPCFAHSRRASFKRAKTCDWCKHIRHTVSYVDFNDGATQLQFCSDKCLNQYKMQIFCKETQAHLDMNPHLKDNFKTSGKMNALFTVQFIYSLLLILDNLITPELWLRNCKSRSVSPDTERSQSPPKDSVASHLFPSPPSMIESIASKSTRPTNCSGSYSPSMRPVSRKRFLRTTINRLMNEAESNSNRQRSGTNKTAPTVIAKPQGHQESHNITSDLPKKTTFPSIMHPMQPRNNIQPPSFLPNRNFNHPLFGANMPFIPSPMNYNFMDALRPTILGSMQPPVTVLVPHPVIIPLPIPIPIPMPLEAFLKAAQSRVVKEEETTKVVQTEIDDMELDESKESVELEEINEPLDCSKSAPSQPLDVRVNDKPKEIISNDERVLTRRSSSAIIVNPSSSKETEINRPLRKRKRLMNYSCTSRATYSNPTLSTEK